MKLVIRKDIYAFQDEADRLPKNLSVIGKGYVMDAERIKVCCETCGRQPGSDYIDIEKLLKKASPAEKYGSMLVIAVDEICQLPFLSEFKCYACGTKNIIN